MTEDGQVVAYVDQEATRLYVRWLDYLRTVDGLLLDIAVEREVRFGDPLTEILAEAEEFGLISSRSRPAPASASRSDCSAAWPRIS